MIWNRNTKSDKKGSDKPDDIVESKSAPEDIIEKEIIPKQENKDLEMDMSPDTNIEEETKNSDLQLEIEPELEVESAKEDGLELSLEMEEEVKEEKLADDGLSLELEMDSEDKTDKIDNPEIKEDNDGLSLEIEEENEDKPEDKPVINSKEAEKEKIKEEKKQEKIHATPQRIGDFLISNDHITEDQLMVALHEKKTSDKLLGEIIVDLGFITPAVLSQFLSVSTGYEEFKVSNAMYDPDALSIVPKNDCIKYQILPISLSEKAIVVAFADPYDIVAKDKLRQLVPRELEIVIQVCTPTILNEAVDQAYGYASSIDDILNELAGGDVDLDADTMTGDGSYSHPIVRLVNALVFDGVKMDASDIHFEPEENFARIRYRIDGMLHEKQTIHGEYWSGIAQRLKIMSGMNIADKMLPQDGRFYLNVGGKEADFRVSTLPTVHGENIVLRILDQSKGIMPMAALGFNDHNMGLINKSNATPEGIIIVTGPTGSGKTTSLYSMLNDISSIDVNIQTLEDPVEYALPLIRQTHVKESTGMTFAHGIKALLRQDPDIIFIGEVRDQVTAEQALKAAMTGHRVYTTLHTNDSFGAIPRLLDLGLKPGMLAGSIISVFAQRLARRLCSCKKLAPATPEECKLLDVDPENPPEIYHGVGCDKCMQTGYKGRTAVIEILFMNDDLNYQIEKGANKAELREVAEKHGFKSMLDDGVEKVLTGVTSLSALQKIVSFTDRM